MRFSAAVAILALVFWLPSCKSPMTIAAIEGMGEALDSPEETPAETPEPDESVAPPDYYFPPDPQPGDVEPENPSDQGYEPDDDDPLPPGWVPPPGPGNDGSEEWIPPESENGGRAVPPMPPEGEPMPVPPEDEYSEPNDEYGE